MTQQAAPSENGRRVSAPEAKQLLDEGYVYVDVRTELEWAMGHPIGARNVPWELRVPGGTRPNPEFITLMKALYPTDTKLLIGCLQGRRSLIAAEQLLSDGYTDVIDVRPGWSGVRNVFGGIEEPGWKACGLPHEIATPGGSYDELRAAAGLLT